MKSQIFIRIAGFGLFMGLVVSSANSQEPRMAPTMPEVQRELPPGRGFVPSRLDLSHLTGKDMPEKFAAVQAPVQWDWRAQGKVTPIKNQGSCGACYAFASLANFESKVLIDDSQTFDFSENNAKECNWYDLSCSGGTYNEIANWLSKKGTVRETCDPYVASNVSCNSTCPYIKTLLDWRIISSDNVPTTTVLQNYIYTYGPIYTTLYTGDGNDPSWSSEFDSYDGSYTLYYTDSWTPNHAVLMVGWDDNLSYAGGTGAWIVKNSWGTSWGDTCGYGSEGGYFTIAYGSAGIGKWSSYVNDWQNYDQNGEILYYDDGGWTAQWGYGGQSAWGMCKFIPSSQGYLTRVEFWTTDATTDIDIYVYDDFDGSSLSSLLQSKLNTSYNEAGYHSVALDSPPEITSGNDIYVAIKFTNSSYVYPLAAEAGTSGETATTYISYNGSSGSWFDLGVNQGDDLAIRARFSPTLGLSVDDGGVRMPYGYNLSQNRPNPFNSSTAINYALQARSRVTISVHNLLGQMINTIVNEVKSAGSHTAYWDGKNYNGEQVATGIYVYRIKAGDFTESKKMLLLK